jgi:DprA/Smf-like nucleotide binding protein involved in DNA uptake
MSTGTPDPRACWPGRARTSPAAGWASTACPSSPATGAAARARSTSWRVARPGAATASGPRRRRHPRQAAPPAPPRRRLPGRHRRAPGRRRLQRPHPRRCHPRPGHRQRHRGAAPHDAAGGAPDRGRRAGGGYSGSPLGAHRVWSPGARVARFASGTRQLGAAGRRVLEALADGLPVAPGRLGALTGLGPGELARALLEVELAGLARRLAAGIQPLAPRRRGPIGQLGQPPVRAEKKI